MPATIPAMLSLKAQDRLRKPRTRGAFQPVDAARRRLGLLSVADGAGQARIYWLVDLASGVVEDSRFLAFGDLASHPLADAFCELARGRTVDDACALALDQVESLLRDDPLTPAVAAGAGGFIADLQERARAALPAVELLPPPADVPAYVRKRRQDWDDADRAWLPLGLLQKIQRAQAVAQRVLAERFPGRALGAEIAGLHDDFQVVVAFAGLVAEQVPTAARFLEDALHALHPALRVEVAR